MPEIVVDYMNQVNQKCGTDYKPFNYYGAPDADRVIIAMGSVWRTLPKKTIDYLRAAGEKVGLIKVHLYRPFCAKYLLDVLPDTVKCISVLDRTKEPGSIGEPLYLDVLAALHGTKFANCPVYTGRYGLSSKDTNPSHIAAVYQNMRAGEPKKRFTIGIVDDVTHLSLPVAENINTTPATTHVLQVLGLGSDGTVGANKNIHQDHRRPDRYVRAGVFCLRLQKVRRHHHFPPALRQDAHQVFLLYQPGRFCRLPQPVLCQ